MIPFTQKKKTHKITLNFNIYSPFPAICKACWVLTVSLNKTCKIELIIVVAKILSNIITVRKRHSESN